MKLLKENTTVNIGLHRKILRKVNRFIRELSKGFPKKLQKLGQNVNACKKELIFRKKTSGANPPSRAGESLRVLKPFRVFANKNLLNKTSNCEINKKCLRKHENFSWIQQQYDSNSLDFCRYVDTRFIINTNN